MASQHEKETQADSATAYSKPLLKTPSPIERQAADTCTTAVFNKFQEEFVESLGYYVDKIEDGPISKYNVHREEDNGKSYMVSFSESDKKANCSCCKFEYYGILCRHVLRVFFIVGVRFLSDEYILKRWTRNVMNNVVLDVRVVDSGLGFQEQLVAWYNDLCLDAVKYGMEGAISAEVYKVAKAAIQKAFSEVVTEKNMQRKRQQNIQRCARLQKMQYKMPLPKLQPKKTSSKEDQHDEAARSGKNDKESTFDVDDSDLNGGSH